MLVTKLYIGLCDKDTKKQRFSDYVMNRKIRTIVCDHGIDSFTMQHATGVYAHNDGATVLENTRIVTIIGISEFKLIKLVDDLKVKLNQECIMVERYECDVRFIY